VDEKPLSAGSVAGNAREHERVNVNWRARIVVGPNQFLDAKVINASVGGVCLLGDHPYRQGTSLQVALAIPTPQDRTRIHFTEVQAKVAYQVMNNHSFKIGLQFTAVDDATVKLIKQWVWS